MVTGNEGTDSNGQSSTPEYNGQVARVDFVESSCESSEDDDDPPDSPSLAVASLGNQERGNFGNIVVSDSRDVHVGNRTIYQGPVTIRQIVYASNGDPHIAREDILPGLQAAPDVETERSDDISLSSSHSHVGVSGFKETHGFDSFEKDTPQPPKCCPRRHCIAWITTAIVVSILTVATLIALTSRSNNIAANRPILTDPGDPGGSTTNFPSSTTDSQLEPNTTLRLVQRAEWSARPAVGTMVLLSPPVPYVIISHTGTGNCTSRDECTRSVMNIQSSHMGHNQWNDIGYNFLVCGDGWTYVGRGWDSVGSHAMYYNSCSIGISFIGTFTAWLPTQQQMEAAELLIAEGVRLGKLRLDYRLLAHRQVSKTDSPGNKLFAHLKKHSHFSERTASCRDVNSELDSILRVAKKLPTSTEKN